MVIVASGNDELEVQVRSAGVALRIDRARSRRECRRLVRETRDGTVVLGPDFHDLGPWIAETGRFRTVWVADPADPDQEIAGRLQGAFFVVHTPPSPILLGMVLDAAVRRGCGS